MMDKEKLLTIIQSIDDEQMATAKKYEDGEITRQEYKVQQNALGAEMDLAQRALRGWKHFEPEARDQGKVRTQLLGVRNRDGFDKLLDTVESQLGHRLAAA